MTRAPCRSAQEVVARPRRGLQRRKELEATYTEAVGNSRNRLQDRQAQALVAARSMPSRR